MPTEPKSSDVSRNRFHCAKSKIASRESFSHLVHHTSQNRYNLSLTALA